MRRLARAGFRLLAMLAVMATARTARAPSG